jgi:hypothetical protein
MKKIYVYRKHLRLPFRYFMLATGYIFMLTILMVLGFIITDEQKADGLIFAISGFIILVIFIFLVLELCIIYVLFLKRFQSISVTLTDDEIIYINSKKCISIAYEDIEKLEFSSVKYMGGCVEIVYKGGAIRLTVVLEDIGEFIYKLKDKINEQNRSHVCSEKKLFSFFKTAVFADESWDRLYHNYHIQLAAHYLCIIITIIILKLCGNAVYNQIFIYGALLAPLFGFILSEVLIGTHVKQRVNLKKLKLLPRNQELEHKSFKYSMSGFLIGYLLFVLVITAIL